MKPQFTIINKHTSRFPCVAKDRYCEFDEPRTKMMFATAQLAEACIPSIEKEAKINERDTRRWAKDTDDDARVAEDRGDVEYYKQQGKRARKKAQQLASRDFAVVKISYEYV